jgi:hypothetical protein
MLRVNPAEDLREEPATCDCVVCFRELAAVVVWVSGDSGGETVEVTEIVDGGLEVRFKP